MPPCSLHEMGYFVIQLMYMLYILYNIIMGFIVIDSVIVIVI